MKKLLLLALLTPIFAFSQIPAGYYDSAEGLEGSALREALNDIISGHTEYEYTDTDTDVWDILKESDQDTSNPANVILIYTGRSVDAAQEYNSGNGWSREHVWAKSRGDFGNSIGPGTDAHHIRPADISTNSARSNRWFAECSEPYLDGGTESTGCFTSSTDWFWKPRKEVKGDIARMIFYMDVRYEGENGEPDLEVIDYIPADDNTKAPVHAKLSDLLQWHYEDPVDDFEKNRNDVIYSYQNNRNPFIDHPEYVERLWPVQTGITTETLHSDIGVSANSHMITVWSPERIESLTLYTLTGRKITTSVTSTLQPGIPFNSGIYVLKIKTQEGYIIKRIAL